MAVEMFRRTPVHQTKGKLIVVIREVDSEFPILCSVRAYECLHDCRSRERYDNGLGQFFFSHIIMGGEAVRFLCFRKFKIPLVHLSFCFVKEMGKDWKSVGNPETAFW
jgi:hypothetical protein